MDVLSGGSVRVDAAASLGGGLRPSLRPVIRTTATNVSVVTGYVRVADSTIRVPEITWVPTTVTEQVGLEQVRIGNAFHTMNVTLTQAAYYNPRATAENQIREYFIEGLDYRNSTIQWSKYGVTSPPASDYKAATYKNFSQLSDTEKAAVWKTLGYLPLYDFSYSSPKTHQTIDGNTTQSTWTPDWAGNDDVIYLIDVDGWDDKYIRMPEGASEDVLRVVSQGAPVVSQETVGVWRELGDVAYTQDKSAFAATTYTAEVDGVSQQLEALDVDDPLSPIRWAVTYTGGGKWTYEMGGEDERTINVASRDPRWSFASTEFEEKTLLQKFIYANKGYAAATGSLAGEAFTERPDIKGGEYYIPGYYKFGGYQEGDIDFWESAEGCSAGRSLSGRSQPDPCPRRHRRTCSGRRQCLDGDDWGRRGRLVLHKRCRVCGSWRLHRRHERGPRVLCGT
ncbi:MAG UNVERIFIED_CONTAM: hypothetical protein LVR18_45800 [Planctomycetaceae bacterium]